MTRKKPVHVQYGRNHCRPKYILLVPIGNNVTSFFQSLVGWIRGCGTHGYGGPYKSSNFTTEKIHGSQLSFQYLYKEYIKFNVCKLNFLFKTSAFSWYFFSINAITMLPSRLKHLCELSVNFTCCPYTPCSVSSEFLHSYLTITSHAHLFFPTSSVTLPVTGKSPSPVAWNTAVVSYRVSPHSRFIIFIFQVLINSVPFEYFWSTHKLLYLPANKP